MKSAKCEIAAGSGSRAKPGRDPRFALDRAMSQRQPLSMQTLRCIEVENLWSLKKVSVDLGPLNVLVGPNGAGKTNLLKAIGFLGDVARLEKWRTDLWEREARGGAQVWSARRREEPDRDPRERYPRRRSRE